jgi:hypothetical protein
MPSSVRDLLNAAGLTWAGAVKWGQPPQLASPGVYIVALTDDPDDVDRTMNECPIDTESLEALVRVRPEVSVDGVNASPSLLAKRIERFWLPDEVVLYVGLTGGSVRKRVRDYYRTPIGARRPHSGGWFLKALANLNELFVHFAPSADPDRSEDQILSHFCAHVADSTRQALFDGDHPFPFANLAWPRGTSKAHRIGGARGDIPGF